VPTSNTLPGDKRPGGRTARTAQAVRKATLDLMSERGRGSLSMNEIALRSGVHEATLYRRWRDVDSIVFDAVTERIVHDAPIPDTGSLRSDLHAWASRAAHDLARPEGFALLEALVRADVTGKGGDEDAVRRRSRARRYLEKRSTQLEGAIERARQRGETAPKLADILDRVLAPLYLRVIFGYRPADDDIEALIDAAIGG
jgi:AcrR family transcriptional regulator